MTRCLDDSDRFPFLQGNGFPIDQLPIHRHTLPHQIEQVGNGSFTILSFDILDPVPLGPVNGDQGPSPLFDRSAAPDMVGVGMGQEDHGDLLRRPSQTPHVIENQGSCGTNTGIDEADLFPDDQIRVHKPVDVTVVSQRQPE